LKVYLHHFSKIIKVKKKSQNSRNQGFSYYFAVFIPDPGSGFLPISDLGYRISDPGSKNSNERQG
jgi:hypothetical protein